MTDDLRRRRIKFRAWHRGTREADLMIGGFANRHLDSCDEGGVAWFEAMLEENEVDVMAWALGTRDAPARFHGPLLDALRRLDYVAKVSR
ncbi:FAD assembly factor SdhE [Glacieibacterium frigidum]|uniref:FAD assembly factor SdhE n=1 Tax=Glacieibacterium frigidum TaxID=2593303 RepID=A0A552U9L4_9SPHN|nr:succinate dehydrogenase assembly factor 2 [Glacieibacterium frigidum]TRW14914.1 succinate dehydrogenase assembly factor 2 [Glacieibacterium frigidum]